MIDERVTRDTNQQQQTWESTAIRTRNTSSSRNPFIQATTTLISLHLHAHRILPPTHSPTSTLHQAFRLRLSQTLNASPNEPSRKPNLPCSGTCQAASTTSHTQKAKKAETIPLQPHTARPPSVNSPALHPHPNQPQPPQNATNSQSEIKFYRKLLARQTAATYRMSDYRSWLFWERISWG